MVDIVKFIFTLSLTESKAIYKIKRDSIEGKIVCDLARLGLVEILHSEKEKKTFKFYVTTLLQ